MLPKENRLKKKKDFQSISGKGKELRNGFLILKFLKNNLEISRFGFVVSKKISNKATIRNKVKRRLREILRIYLPKIKLGYDLIFFTRKGIEEKKFQEIKEKVEYLLTKAKIFYRNWARRPPNSFGG